jgi:hypothetical protein
MINDAPRQTAERDTTLEAKHRIVNDEIRQNAAKLRAAALDLCHRAEATRIAATNATTMARAILHMQASGSGRFGHDGPCMRLTLSGAVSPSLTARSIANRR